MHRALQIPVIDAHAHIMTTDRIRSGMRWLQKYLPDVDIDLTLDEPRARQMLAEAGVDYYFNAFFPIFAGTTTAVNEWNYALSLRDPRAVPFVSLLPGDEEKEKILAWAFRDNYFLGLKFHPYVQRFSILDPRLDEVYAFLQELGRPVIIHSGHEDVYGVPDNKREIAALLKKFPRLVLVIPHLCYPDLDAAFAFLEAYPHIYLDATNVFWLFQKQPPKEIWWEKFEQFSERIVFGTDFTMGMAFPARLYEHFATLPLASKTKEDLLYRTALRMARKFGWQLNQIIEVE
ncbi:MAG: amidohydrolase family protein [Bacillota bacterium]